MLRHDRFARRPFKSCNLPPLSGKKRTADLGTALSRLAMAASCIWSYAKTFREELATEAQKKAWLHNRFDPFFSKRLYYVVANTDQSLLPTIRAIRWADEAAFEKISDLGVLAAAFRNNAVLAYDAIFSDPSFRAMYNAVAECAAGASGKDVPKLKQIIPVDFGMAVIEQLQLSAAELERRTERYQSVSDGSNGVQDLCHPERGNYSRITAHFPK
jgi:hypothetical protein